MLMNGPCGVHCDRFNAYLKASLLYLLGFMTKYYIFINRNRRSSSENSFINWLVRSL